jgi:hypothetical protein
MYFLLIIAILCAPNLLVTLPRYLQDDTRAFLHAILYWIVLVLYLVNDVSEKEKPHVDVVNVVKPAVATTATTAANPVFLAPPSIMFPITTEVTAPPPLPILAPVSIPTPFFRNPLTDLSVTNVKPTLPSWTPLPSFLPSIVPGEKPSYAPVGGDGGGGGSSPASFAIVVAPPAACPQQCIPLPLAAPSPQAQLAPSPSPPPKDDEWKSILTRAIDRYNALNGTTLRANEWVRFLEPNHEVAGILAAQSDARLTQIITRLQEMQSPGEVKEYIHYISSR